MIFTGKAWVFGDHIDTDAIIAARHLVTTDPAELARYCLEGANPDFARQVQPGDLVVGGKNFGCGSSREHAPLALKGAGVACVIAPSFARIFYRNAVNIGLPILECPSELSRIIASGEELQVDLEQGLITRLADGSRFQGNAVPPFMREIMQTGGLINYVQGRLNKKP